MVDASGTTADSRSASLAMYQQAILLRAGRIATVYPAEVNVSGWPPSTSKVTVTLYDLSHVRPQDLRVLVVSPAGQKVILMANAGGSVGIPANAAVTLTFDDAAASPLPVPISEGAWQPSAFPEIYSLPPGAPPTPYETALSAFNGASPNGTWKLYVYDAGSGGVDTGRIAGSWCLTVAP